MSKLYFRYAAMNAGKSTHLLQAAYNYEERGMKVRLFTAALDNPGSWTDLEGRGLRGFVLGIAFDEFMQHLAERARRGERVDDDLASRALQVADRMSLSTTQRAITASTARRTAGG